MNTGLIWAALILELGLLEAWLALHGWPTLSQWLWKQYRRHWWSRYVVLGLLVVLTLHLVLEVFGGPHRPPSPDPCDPDCADCSDCSF